MKIEKNSPSLVETLKNLVKPKQQSTKVRDLTKHQPSWMYRNE